MLTPFARRVISRTRLLKRAKAFGAMTRWTTGPSVKLNPMNFRCCGRATAAVPKSMGRVSDLNNHGHHKTVKVRLRRSLSLCEHPRSTYTYTPTSASWICLPSAERWFARLTSGNADADGCTRTCRRTPEAALRRHRPARINLPSHLFGPKPPTPSWKTLLAFLSECMTQDTSALV